MSAPEIARVNHGTQRPNSLPITATPTDPTLDMRTVTGASIEVLRADGSTTTWTCVVVSATADSITVRHDFDVTDWPSPPVYGAWLLTVVLTVPGGTVECEERTLLVTDSWGRTTG